VGLTVKEARLMDVNPVSYFRRTLLVVAAAFLSFGVTAPASSSPFGPTVFTGGGYGPTADVAIQGALWDAQESASYYQFYSCRMVGDVRIFTRTNARGGRNFTAEVTIACS
jgi:hypothetical protein